MQCVTLIKVSQSRLAAAYGDKGQKNRKETWGVLWIHVPFDADYGFNRGHSHQNQRFFFAF